MALNQNFRKPETGKKEEEKKPQFSFADLFKTANQKATDYQNNWLSYIRAAMETTNKLNSPFTVNSTTTLSAPSTFAVQGMQKNAAKTPVLGDYVSILEQALAAYGKQRPMDVSQARKLGADISAFDGTNAVNRTTWQQEEYTQDAQNSGNFDSPEYLKEGLIDRPSDDYLKEQAEAFALRKQGRQQATAEEVKYLQDALGIEDVDEAQRLWKLAIYEPDAFAKEFRMADAQIGEADPAREMSTAKIIFDLSDMFYKTHDLNDSEYAGAMLSLINKEQKRREAVNAFYQNPDRAAVLAMDNFAQFAAYNPALTGTGRIWTLYKWLNDPQYREEQRRNRQINATLMNSYAPYEDVWDLEGYGHWSPQNIGEFNALLTSEDFGPEAAERYENLLQASGMPTMRRAKEQTESLAELSSDPLGAAVLYPMTFASQAFTGFAAPFQLAMAAFGYDDPNGALYDWNRFTQTPRQAVGQNVYDWAKEWGGDVAGSLFKFGLDALTTIGDVALTRKISGVSRLASNPQLAGNVMQVLMSSQAVSNTLYAGLQNGDSTEGAIAKAILAGAIEAFTEKYSIHEFMKNPANGVRYFLNNMVVEGSEEAVAEVLTNLSDEAISALVGDLGPLTEAYNNALMSGKSTTFAAFAALGEFAKNVGYSAALGTAVGGMSAAPGAVAINAENTQTGTRVLENDAADQLLALAETMPEGSESRKVAENIRKRMKPVTKMEAKQAEAAPEVKQAEVAPEVKQEAPVQQEQDEQAVSEMETTTEAKHDTAETPVAETIEAPTETAQNAPQEAAEEQTADNTQETAQAPETKETPKKKGKRISPAKLGQLYRTLYNDLDAQGKQTVSGVMENSVKGRLAELGEDQASINEVAAPLAKLLADDTLTNKEKQIITKSKNGLRVFNEIRFAEDDTYSSNWVAEAGTQKSAAEQAINETRSELDAMLAPKVLRPAVEAAQRTVAESGMAVANAKHGTDAKLGVQLTGEGGKTQDAEILQVTGVTKQGMQVKVKGSDGQTKTVDMADMKFANSDTATIAAYIQKAPHVFTAEEANKMMQTYMGGDVQEHISGFTTLYNAGYAGRTIPPSKLPQAQVIYDLGKQDAATDEANRLKGIGTGKRGTGKVTFAPGVQRAGLNKVQRDSEYLLRVFAKAHGMDFVLYESSADADGYYRAANGRYQNNTLYIDMNSGKNSATDTAEYAILRTAAHEITHYIEHNSAEGYARLKDYVKNEYARKGKSWDNLVEAKLATRTMNSRLTRAGAEAEVMADAMEMMLQDSKAIERLQKRDQSLYEKIKRFIVDYFRKVREAFANVGAVHKEAKWLMEEGADGVMHYAEKMVQLWDEALVEAVETVQGSTAEEAGIEIDTATESAYAQNSVRTWNTSQYVQNRDKAAKQLAESLHVTEQEAADWIDDVNSIAAIVLQDKVRLDYFPSEFATAFKSNPEYGGSIDMSTICAKRRLATGTLDAIQNKLGDVALTKDDFLRIREMMKKRKYEVACGLCFVESSRKNLSKYTKQFIDIFNISHPDATVTMPDFNTVEGLENMRSTRPDAYEAYEKFMNKLAQRKPKLFEMRTEYRHEILNRFAKDTSVGAKNMAGGLRLQSFSDFEIVHLIDMMQVITDMASVGLAGQAYTKVPDFAWALGNTGLKINLSLIAKGVDENGNLVYDDVEGMNHNEAKKLRDAYSENVGTVVVTFTDEQLIAAMKDDFVDFIIPFHRSQWQKSDYKVLGLPEGTKDYTLHQNEKYGRKRVKENYAPNAYWDFSLTGKENAQKYLDMCAADGRTPKFAKFLQNNGDGTYSMKADGSTDGYWKLLIDFKMYDNDGNGSKQLPVRPEFNMDEARRMLKDYKGGHESFPVAQDVVDDFVREYTGGQQMEAGDVQYSPREYGLDEINDDDKNNIISRGNGIVYSRVQLEQHVYTALNTKEQKSIFIGNINEQLKKKLEAETNVQLFRGDLDYAYGVSYDCIRHIKKHFGSVEEIADAIQYIFTMISNHDRIEPVQRKDGGYNLKITKDYSTVELETIAETSKRTRSLTVKTAYISRVHKKGATIRQADTSNKTGAPRLDHASKEIIQPSFALDNPSAEENFQESLREITPHTLAYSYMETMQPTTSMNESERWLLDKYQRTVKELQEKQEAYNEQRNLAANSTSAEERTKAKARANLLDKQMGHLRETLRKAERSEGFATLMNTAQKVAERFMTDENNLLAADASDRLDNELADVQAQLKAITKQLANAETGQRTAFAKGLFNAKALNEAGQTIRKAFNTRMSGKEISNRLALAYAELYAENNPERFAAAMRALAQDVLESSKSRYRSPVLADLKDNIGSIGLSEAQKQELAKNGITISDFKRVVNPVVQVIDGGANLGTIVSSAEYYGTGIISQLSSADSEGDMIMTLYKTIQDERAKEAEAAMEGMTREESIGYTMAEIMNTANFPLAENGANLDAVRNALTEGIEGNRAIATQVDKALATAKRASASAGNLWRKATEINSAGKQAVEYYRAIDEQRRLLEQEELVLQLKSEAAQELKKQRQDFRDRMDRDRRVRDMNMKAAQHRKHLASTVKKLDNLIRHETDYKHVPEDLKPLVETLVSAFANKGAGIVFDKKKADRLAEVYRKLEKADGTLAQYAMYYDPDILAQMEELGVLLERELQTRNGAGMALKERAAEKLAVMENLADIADNVYKMVKDANNLFYGGKKVEYAKIGTEAANEMNERPDHKQLAGKAGKWLQELDNFVRKGNMTPVYFFDQLKNTAFKTLFGDMLAGQEVYAKRMYDARQYMQETREQYHYDTWANDDKLTMTTEQGHKITLDKEQAMSLYAMWKREHADELLPSYHLEEGGFVYESSQLPTEGKGLKKVVQRTTPSKLTKADMAQIEAYLTAEQKAYADAVVNYMSTTMAEYGNETSMELYGIRKYKEDYYFPFKSDSNQMYQSSTSGGGQVTDDNRLKHRSFTKARVRSAANALVLGNFSEVAANHMVQMILYSSMTTSIESMNRVLNYKTTFKDGSQTTIRALLEQKYGTNMKKYLETFLSDMNGGVRRDSREAGLARLMSLFKRGAVMASLSVVVQQPTSILRATAMIDPKYLMKTHAKKGSYDELKNHSGVAILKEMGRFDMDMGAANADWLLEADEGMLKAWQRVREAAGRKDWAGARETAGKSLESLLTAAPGKADEVTWAWLWEAVKAEQAEANPGMNTSSEAFLDLCGERFNDIVNHTQVYDSTLVRSQSMRSKSGLMQMATSFMAEPTLSANMLYDAIANNASRGGKKYAVRAAVAVLASQLATALAQALVSAGRDKDEKKTWAEKYAGKAAANIASNLNPMNMLPVLSDIQSLLDGYDVTRADMSIFAEIKKAFDKLGNENMSAWEKVDELTGSLAKLVGIPYKNISRDIKAMWTTFFGNADRPTSGYAVGEAVKGGLIPGYDTKPEAYYERAYQAMNKGDQATVDTIREYMTTVGGKKDEEVDSGIAKRLRARVEDGKITKDDAIKWLVKHKLEKSEKKAFDEVDEWTDTKAYKDIVDDYSYKKYGEIEMALKKGDTKTVKTLMDEMLKYGNKEDDVISAIKTSIGNLYKNGELTKAEATKLYKHYDPKADDEDIFWLHDKWDLNKKNADVDGYNWTKTGAFLDSIPNGGSNMVKEARKLLDNGVKKRSISSAIKKRYKDQFVELYKKGQAANLLARLLSAYEAIGYNRGAMQSKIMSWLTEDEEE